MLNTSLANAIRTVVQATNYTQYLLSLKFLSASDSTYSYTPIHIEGMKIEQDSEKSYSDYITVQLMISMGDYASMYEHIQDLYVVVKLTYCDIQGNVVSTKAPLVKKYRAAIIDPKDAYKEHVDVHIRTNELDRHIDIRLIEEEIMAARSVEINTIFQTCSIEGALHAAADAFGINAVTAVTPDNTHIYDHILVPPTKSLSNFYAWLHAKYGVYMAGICHYYTNDHLFIYAPFDTDPTTETTLVVYQAEQGMYAGNSNFSKATDNKYEIVTNSITKVTDLATYGSENVGTSVMFLRSSEMVDGVVQRDPSSGIKFNDDVVLNVSLQAPKTLNAKQNKTIYAHATDNPFALASHIVEHQATLLHFQWSMAVPFVLRPGLAVVFYSDKAGKILRRTGIIESIDTLIKRMEQSGSGRIYKASANVVVRLQPEGVETDTVS